MLNPDFEAEVRGNILNEPLGNDSESGTVADLNLSHEFLTRQADRVLRASFYHAFRTVVATTQEIEEQGALDEAARGAAHQALAAARDGSMHASVSVEVRLVSDSTEQPALWSAHDDSSPVMASFRSPACLGTRATASDASSQTLNPARRVARKHLARDGLLVALARVIAAIGPDVVKSSGAAASLLQDAGIPTDLLAFVRPEFVAHGATPDDIIVTLAHRLASGESIEKLGKSLKRCKFQPAPSLPGFRPTSDSGHDTFDMVRMHATRATFYTGTGDGGNLDLMLGVLGALPRTPAIIAAKTEDATALRDALAHASRTAPITIVPQPLLVSQWAADNAKPGAIGSTPAHLAPRYVSRGEYFPLFISGDDLAAEMATIPSARSPLLFHGGNLMMVDDLPRSRRVLLIGEAEIHRNRALGLSTEQVLAFFRAEFGADVCEVLPAASYHIDQEVSVRSTANATLAFVADPLLASMWVIERSLSALLREGRWSEDQVRLVVSHIEKVRLAEAAQALRALLVRERTPEGAFPFAFADALSLGPADSGVGNLHRFLLAVDQLVATVVSVLDLTDVNTQALHRTFQRRAADRAKIRTLLTRLGWKVVPVAAIPEDSRGINPLNGIHTPDAYLMPAYGGLFAKVDNFAADTFRQALGPEVSVIPVASAESQRREGALRCSLACYGH